MIYRFFQFQMSERRLAPIVLTRSAPYKRPAHEGGTCLRAVGGSAPGHRGPDGLALPRPDRRRASSGRRDPAFWAPFVLLGPGS